MFLMTITRREAQVLRYIRRHVVQHGCTPTPREIVDQFGMCPPECVAAHLNALQRKGCIHLTPGRYRSIELAETNLGPQQIFKNLLREGTFSPAAWRQESNTVLCHP